MSVRQAHATLRVLFPNGRLTAMKDIAVADFKPFLPRKVQVVLDGMAIKNSPGPQRVPMALIRVVAETVLWSMTELFNLIIKEEKVPPEWRPTQEAKSGCKAACRL